MTAINRRSFLAILLAITCTAALVLLGVPRSAHAVTAAEKQAQADAAAAKLSDWQTQLDIASDAYFEAQSAHDDAVAGMNEAQARIDAAEAQKAALQAHLSTRAKSMYRSGNISFVDVLLGSDSFENFVTTWDTLNELNAEDEAYVDQEKAVEQEATNARAEYSAQEQVAAEKVAEADQIKEQADAAVAQYQAEYNSLDAEAKSLLAQEQAAAAAAAAAAASTPSSSASDSSGSSSSGGGGGATYEGGGDIVSRAYACMGAPYVWGAVGPEGYDCSGLVSYCITGSHTRVGTASTFAGWPEASNPEPGDICANSHHCGIYIGGGQMINAFDFGVGVIISPVNSDMVIVIPQ